MEQNLAIIKPDAVAARLVGAIILRIEAEEFTVKGIRLLHLKKSDAEGFYAVHREKPFFDSLTTFMSSGPIVVLALEAPDAINRWRRLMGATDPGQADPGTLRREYGTSIDRNATHGSDAKTTAVSELGYFFSAIELNSDA